jgi:hypothetical protein
VPHGNHDQNIQQVELPHENTRRYQALVLISYQTNFLGSKGNVINRVTVDMSIEDQ